MENVDEDHLFHYRVRPKFHIETHHTIDELNIKLEAALQEDGAPVKGWVDPHYAKLSIPHEDQHYWSPRLSISFEETDGGTMMRGVYGPRPSVWTLFIFFYAFIGFGILIILILGTSYISLGKSGAILWFVPVLLLIFLTLYLVSYFGQKLGHDQMVTLHHFVENCIGHEIHDD